MFGRLKRCGVANPRTKLEDAVLNLLARDFDGTAQRVTFTHDNTDDLPTLVTQIFKLLFRGETESVRLQPVTEPFQVIHRQNYFPLDRFLPRLVDTAVRLKSFHHPELGNLDWR